MTYELLYAYRREQCHWSNEVCSGNTDCCSKNCYLAHEGTDYRCTRSSLNQTCVFDYHCRDGLHCGNNYRCCSPYWENCVLTRDCCDKEHVCTSTPGFIYKKCLYPGSGVRSSAEWNMLAILPLLTISMVTTL
ncbi:uncharacterized protein [Haliotis cracherodii]|uniref:uncharacterized protein n=1 Tax=Haliotis cracherodii TaxID=6455 RepID=UPI0039E9A941